MRKIISLTRVTTGLERVISLIVRHPRGAILLLFLFHAIITISIVRQHSAPFTLDEAEQFWYGGYYLDQLSRGGIPPLAKGPLYAFHPPLVRLISVPFYVLWGYSPHVAVISTLPALLLLLFSVFSIGKELHSVEAGLLAAALTSFFPGIVSFSRTYLLDVSLTAAVALSVAVLLKTKNFSHTAYTILFGVSIGLGMLTKLPFSIFLIGPVISCTCRALRGTERGARCQPLKKLILAVLIGSAICAPWYLANWEAAVVSAKAVAMKDSPFILGGVGQALQYLVSLYGILLGPSLAVAIPICLGLGLQRRSVPSLLLWWIIPPYLFFSFFVTQSFSRYLLPSLPAFGLCLALLLRQSSSRAKRPLAVLVLAISLVQFIFISYVGAVPHPLERWRIGGARADSRDWRVSEVTEILTELMAHSPNRTVAGLDFSVYSPGTIEYLMFMGKIPRTNVYGSHPCEWNGSPCERPVSFYEQILANSGVFVATSGFFSEAEGSHLLLAWGRLDPPFNLAASLPLPDGEQLLIFSR